ncbi:MAG: response regulator [Pseudomonadota bacterium]|nr:response regulator [Pseudomonadota bacterium]
MNANPAAAPGRHLLVVDDDDRIRELLKEYLARAGFRVTTAADAARARKLMQTLDFDLAVLDVMMPGEDGLSLSRWVRGRGPTPVLILTARGEAQDRIAGLTTGADDYLQKPFEPQELLLRIEAILRRAHAAPSAPRSTITLGRFAFDLDRGELTEDGAMIRLTEGEVWLLRRMAQAPHMAIDRYELIRSDEGDRDASARAVDVQMTRLRRKIEDDPKTPRYLQTVRGVGYKLAPD